MSLTEEERERLADVVRLQPTKNGDLGDRWGLADGSAVHGYLEEHLGEYYYRDDDSLIRATEEAADLVDVDPGVEGDGEEGPSVLRVPRLQAQVLDVLAGPEERSQSVVSVLQDLRAAFDVDPTAEAVREALNRLKRTDAVAVVYRTVPTYRLAVPRESIEVEVVED